MLIQAVFLRFFELKKRSDCLQKKFLSKPIEKAPETAKKIINTFFHKISNEQIPLDSKNEGPITLPESVV